MKGSVKENILTKRILRADEEDMHIVKAKDKESSPFERKLIQ